MAQGNQNEKVCYYAQSASGGGAYPLWGFVDGDETLRQVGFTIIAGDAQGTTQDWGGGFLVQVPTGKSGISSVLSQSWCGETLQGME